MYNHPTINDQYEQVTMHHQHQPTNNSYYFDPRSRYHYHQSLPQVQYGAGQPVNINPSSQYAQATHQANPAVSMMPMPTGAGGYLLYNSSAPGMTASNIAGGANCNNSPGTGGSGTVVNMVNDGSALTATTARPGFGYEDCYKANGNTCFVSETTNSPSFCLEAVSNPYMIYNCATNENLIQQETYQSGSFAGIALRNQTIIPKLEKCSPDPAELSADFFCSVPGRLSLLSSTSKYRVSISEIHRRISQPECLNASLLGGILRRAKSKNGGKLLRQRLESIGVRLPAGRRKAATITVLTAMVEGEALQLASDYDSVCKVDFPTKECANYIHKRKYSADQNRTTNDSETVNEEILLRKVKIARKFAEDFAQLLHDDRSPTTIRNEMSILDESIQSPLTRFSMVTHGFGIPAITTAMEAYISYLNELEEVVAEKGVKRSHCEDDSSKIDGCSAAKHRRLHE